VNDKELADKVVALGVGCTFEWGDTEGVMRQYWAPDSETSGTAADKFVCDWRVAGALMEKVFDKKYSFMVMQMPDDMPVMTIQAPITTGEEYGDPSKRRSWASQVVAEPLPRAIIEACVEALS